MRPVRPFRLKDENMNHIDKLLVQAKKIACPTIYSAFCIIDRDVESGKWVAAPELWDKGFNIRAIPRDWQTEYDTSEEAVEAVNGLYESLDIKDPERLVILIDDVGALED